MRHIVLSLLIAACSTTAPQTKVWILDSKLMVLRGFKTDGSDDISTSQCLLPTDPELKNHGMVCFVVDEASKTALERYVIDLETELNACSK